jgi:acyl dehydratase
MKVLDLDTLENLVGQETGRGEWFTIDQERITRFADVTEDHQWIHEDVEAAAAGPFGRTIAHGYLTLSMVSHLMQDAAVMPGGASMYINYGTDTVRFLNPVTEGSRIRAIATLKRVDRKSADQILVTTNIVVEIEGEDRPAMVADILSLAILDGDGA